jgi:NTE family protein
MKTKLAFVLGGGGSRGAMQVGALRALLEAGYHPDLVTGTSIGAANAAFLAVHGYTLQGIQKLERVWQSTLDQDLLPTNLWWQTMRAFFKRTQGFSQQRVRKFAIDNGLSPNLRFADLEGARFYPVAADLNTGCPVIFGLNPQESVLESVMASMALPPWMAPAQQDGRYLVDGGAVSNLPVEAAMLQGATQIIALDLLHYPNLSVSSKGLGGFFLKLDQTVAGRESQLELKLAEVRGVKVQRICLATDPLVPLWDFRQSVELIERGYERTRQAISSWPAESRPTGWRKMEIETIVEEFLEALE